MSWGAGAGVSLDARASGRVNVHWRARVLVSAQAFTEGRTVNVSEQGVCLQLAHNLPDGLVLSLALAVPDLVDRARLHVVTAQARVVFNVATGGQFRLGLQFTQLPPQGRQAICAWVQHLS